MASHQSAVDQGVSAWKVLAVMVVVLLVGIGAVALFGYPALIVLALAGTAAMLCTLVVMTAGR
ncbi:hypothetical protein [Pleomorphomonas sp. PLEO]|uniref:hypothetical protein n=1 Tax=Pleomorphomonas sp. PLEO TaxID=3239306 RepID=UPI00351DC6AD